MPPLPELRSARAILAAVLAAALLALASGCAAIAAPSPADGWEERLRGNSVVLLGEVHDNPDGHARRLQALQRAIARGWRPVIAMEQFDIDRQADIDRARREQPRDADHLIAQAGGAGWDWPLYRPLVQLALDHELPLLAANLPRATTARLVREPASVVLGAGRAGALGLDDPLDPDWQQAQQREIDAGHCGALPPRMLPGMVLAQTARDAVMAERIAARALGDDGLVLIAGNGHVRRDLGVPRWLRDAQRIDPMRVLAVGYLEADEAPAAYDAVVRIEPRTDRPDPCAGLRSR